MVPEIEFDGFLEQRDSIGSVRLDLPTEILPTLKQRIIGAWILRLGVGNPRLIVARELHRHGHHDLADDLVLESKEIAERAVITLGPQVVSADAIDQLGVDPHLIALPAHAALQHVTDTQHKAHRIESTGPSPPVRKSNRRPRSAIAVIPSRRGSVQPQAEIIFGSGLRSG